MSEITQDPTGFSKSITVTHDSVEFYFHKLEFHDKIILNIAINGILDTTFEVPMTTKATINYMSSLELESEDQNPEPNLLVGDYSNLKIQIIASQICKLLFLSSPKDAIISIGSRWFGKGDQVEKENDFEKLMFILSNVKKLL